MDALETLAVALGFATLAGLNLYLTVFLTGIAINQGWVDVATKYPELTVLGTEPVLIAARIFFALEFFSDKIPWVDSLWDSIHTLIRPIGGGLLAMHTLGPTDPAFEVIVAMLAGGTTLVAHSFKAGSRLAINASPEPFTNIAASVGEDIAVVGGLFLLWEHPLVFGVVCIIFLCFVLYLLPKLFRRIKAFFWLIFHKFGSPFGRKKEADLGLYSRLSSDQDIALSDGLSSGKPDVAWALRVLVGKNKGNRTLINSGFGTLICANGSPRPSLHFVGKRWFRSFHTPISLDSMEIVHEPRFLSENVVIFNREIKRKLIFRLHAGQRALAERVVEALLEIRNGISPNVEEKSEKNAEISKKETEATVS